MASCGKNTAPRRVVPNPSGQMNVLHIKLVRKARKVRSLPCFPSGKEMQTQAW